MPDYPAWCIPDTGNFTDNRCTAQSAIDASLPNWCIFEGNWTNSQCQSTYVAVDPNDPVDPIDPVTVETGAVVETVPNIAVSQQIFAQQIGFVISLLIGFAVIKMLAYRKPIS